MNTSEIAIDYKVNAPVSSRQFIELLTKTSLGTRRPLSDSAWVIPVKSL